VNATVISCEAEDIIYRSIVAHECTLGEFLYDLRDKTRRYLKLHKKSSGVDLFWHLDDYCNEKYGTCPWQGASIVSLLLHSGASPKEE